VFKTTRGFIPLLLAIVAALLLPFSFTLMVIFFVILAIAAVTQTHMNPEKYEDIEFYFVALKRGLLVAKPEGEHVTQNETQRRYSKLLPGAFLIFLLVVICTPVFYAVRFFMSDMIFESSLVAASQNNGLQTYNQQIAAIKMFPYRDLYYRSFAQTNLALANSLALSQKSGKLTQQEQQNIVTLIQQSITAARSATTVAPLTSFNWNNLSTIYRSLIGFGQNADQFALVTDQQAIALDTNNPQQYVDLGGIYYQVGQYDNAIREFQIAVNLKPDYANAYYNLGHALESKGDFQNALSAYQTVKSLVGSNQDNINKINAEINAVQAKIGNQQKGNTANTQTTGSQTENQQPLNVNQAETQLPERNPQVKIPAPTVSVKPSASPEPTGAGIKPSSAATKPTATQ
jgi:tetratricopeptide (TPR) repeat protein